VRERLTSSGRELLACLFMLAQVGACDGDGTGREEDVVVDMKTRTDTQSCDEGISDATSHDVVVVVDAEASDAGRRDKRAEDLDYVSMDTDFDQEDCPEGIQPAHPLYQGVTRFDLCEEGGESPYPVHGDSPECDEVVPQNYANDRLFHFTLSSKAHVRIELRDVDRQVDVDTVLSLRTRCDADRELACSDDVSCCLSHLVSQACIDGLQLGESRISRLLAPGT